jgi:SAM-dependent methyltransferase
MTERTGKYFREAIGEALNKTELAAWEVFAEHIHRGQTAVVIGPGAGIADDASFLTAAHFLGRSGLLRVVDPKSFTRSAHNDPDLKGPVRGAGNIDLYLRQLTYFYDGGMDMALPIWVGPEGTCASTTLPNQSCDIIIDHDTSPFVTVSSDKSKQIYWLNKTYNEYARILRPGGVLLLQTSNQRHEFGKRRGQISLMRLLEDSGFSVTTQKVIDKFYIPLSSIDANLLKTVPIDTEVFDKISHNVKEGKPGVYYFEREARQSSLPHKSVDMYLGIRK